MATPKYPQYPPLTPEQLKRAVLAESTEFEQTYRWLEQHMPPSFLNEIDSETRTLIARNLLSFSLQDRFIHIRLKDMAIVCCMDGPGADLSILKPFSKYTIHYYRSFASNEPPPGQTTGHLRIGAVYFRDLGRRETLSAADREQLSRIAKEENPSLGAEECEELVNELTPRFLRAMTTDRLRLALKMFSQAKVQDRCQYEVRKNEDWEAKEAPSMQIVLAWRNVPKGGFLYRLAKIIYSHNLVLQRVVAAYINPHSTENVVLLSLGLHGVDGKAVWEQTDVEDFLRELALTKFFDTEDLVETTFVNSKLLTGNEVHLVRNFISFVHQVLVYADPNLYSLDAIIDGFCRHPELTIKLCRAFEMRFHPQTADLAQYEKIKTEFLMLVEKLDTGHAINDLRRKNILRQGMRFTHYTLKTNFYRTNKTSFSFRLNPEYLDEVPYNRQDKFPELPFGIFFIRGMHFIGFNIRFKDLARGGVRTVIPEKREQFQHERNHVFSEAYNLAYTQQKKNKDIPEGGAKTAILLKPMDVFALEETIFRKELEETNLPADQIEDKLAIYRGQQRQEYINSSQRCFIDSLLSLINCDEKGILRSKSVLDYWKKPEYIYLGPDENISNEMIDWIANYAVQCAYKPGRAFMSSKPGGGINHKEYGVTSYGVNVYLEETLRFLNIEPKTQPFTIKISGGPDGDVAGNELLNLYRFYPNTAKLLALTDVSGTIYDPKGLDLKEMADLFHKTLPIRNYPPEKLSDGGYLLDLKTRKEESAFAQKTLLWRKQHGKLVQDWLSGNEMNLLYRNSLHQVMTDIFMPGGGRPRTLNEANVTTYLNAEGKPTSKAIVEGANLYLTPLARRSLEELGTLVLKDSSCNKGGVITSSFEVLFSLCMSEEAFLKEKAQFVKEVLEIIRKAAFNEARLLLDTHKKTNQYLTDISEAISAKINLFKYQLLSYLETVHLSNDPNDLLIKCLIHYCPPLLRKQHLQGILSMPDIHKKAIIACHIAARLVYYRGLEWTPNIVDVLPTLINETHLFQD